MKLAKGVKENKIMYVYWHNQGTFHIAGVSQMDMKNLERFKNEVTGLVNKYSKKLQITTKEK